MNYSSYFAIEKKLQSIGFDGTREQLILQFTSGAKSGLRQLTPAEYKSFIDWLNAFMKGTVPVRAQDTETRMRRKIIALFCQMGWTNGPKADMERINAWCEKYGKLHKRLNDYHGADLTKLVTQVQDVYTTFLARI